MSDNKSEFQSAANNLLPAVIKRGEVPAITHVLVSGIERYVGEVRDFRHNLSLAAFLPNEGRTSLSWVHLNADEIHQTHKHPTASMVIICEGKANLTGDVEQPVEAGDIVIVPPQSLHGFTTAGSSGLWGLSIQFEGKGLYEEDGKPRIQAADSPTSDRFEPLELAQRAHSENYAHNQLVHLVSSYAIKQDKGLQDNLLDVLQVWADHFQKLIRIRSASTKSEAYSALADQHMKEEFDHNKILSAMRGNRPVQIWDSVFEGACAWFAERMAKGTEAEATIIMHLVIEEAGDIFHKAGAKLFQGSQHFEFHGEHDEDHAAMGLRILKRESSEPVENLVATLNQGWAMMNLLCERMAEMAQGQTIVPKPPTAMHAVGQAPQIRIGNGD